MNLVSNYYQIAERLAYNYHSLFIVIAKVSASKTYAVLSNTHVDAVLKAYQGSSIKVVVVRGITIHVNQPPLLGKVDGCSQT